MGASSSIAVPASKSTMQALYAQRKAAQQRMATPAGAAGVLPKKLLSTQLTPAMTSLSVDTTAATVGSQPMQTPSQPLAASTPTVLTIPDISSATSDSDSSSSSSSSSSSGSSSTTTTTTTTTVNRAVVEPAPMDISHGASTNTTVTSLPFSSQNTSQDINQMDVSGFSPPQPLMGSVPAVLGINSSLPPPPQEVSLFTLPGTPVDSSTLQRGKAMKKKRAKPPSNDSSEGDDVSQTPATPTPSVTSTTPGRSQGSVKPPKKNRRPVAVVESLFKKGSEAQLNPAETIDELMEQKKPRLIKISDGGGFRAQLLVPCEFVLPEERKHFLEEWDDAELKKAEKRNSSQNKLAALSDWEFRRKTASRHCIQKRLSTIQELLDYMEPGEDEDTKSLMADLAYEEEGVSPDSDPNNPLWKLASYPFQLCDMQLDILIVLSGIPEYSPEAGLITEDQARDNMVTLMEGLLSHPDPRTGKVH